MASLAQSARQCTIVKELRNCIYVQKPDGSIVKFVEEPMPMVKKSDKKSQKKKNAQLNTSSEKKLQEKVAAMPKCQVKVYNLTKMEIEQKVSEVKRGTIQQIETNRNVAVDLVNPSSRIRFDNKANTFTKKLVRSPNLDWMNRHDTFKFEISSNKGKSTLFISFDLMKSLFPQISGILFHDVAKDNSFIDAEMDILVELLSRIRLENQSNPSTNDLVRSHNMDWINQLDTLKFEISNENERKSTLIISSDLMNSMISKLSTIHEVTIANLNVVAELFSRSIQLPDMDCKNQSDVPLSITRDFLFNSDLSADRVPFYYLEEDKHTPLDDDIVFDYDADESVSLMCFILTFSKKK